MANKNIAGHEGTLAVAIGNAWKPVGCLTSTSYSATTNMLEKVNMCTQGEVVQTPSGLTRSLQVEAEAVDTTAVGGITIEQSLEELRELQEDLIVSKVPAKWRLSRGPNGDKFFEGFISELSDNFQAGEDATFSFNLTVQSKPTSVDPLLP